MIFQTTITDYTGTVFKNLGSHVVNTNRIDRPRAVNGSGSQFFYPSLPKDRRSNPMPAYCDASLLSIQANMDASLYSNVMELKAFVNNDITQSTVSKYINYKDFIFAFAHRLLPGYSWVTIWENFSISKILINESLADLVNIALTGETTSTEWDDGVSYFRLQVRSGSLFLDQTITATGFPGTEETDWDDIFEESLA